MTTTTQRPEDWPGDDFVSTDELLRRHDTRPIVTVEDLAATDDPFESNTEHDDFLTDLYASRRADVG